MGKLILFNMMTVDGFFEGKNKEIDWHNVDDEFNDFAIEQLNSADTLIFGRLTYELMSGYWPTINATKDDPVVAEKMNSIRKVVISTTLEEASWNNTKLIKENINQEITKLKQQLVRNIFIFGSANLAFTLMHAGLIDEYRVLINPVILGQGNPLFLPDVNRHNLKLLNSRQFKSGNVLLIYEPKK